MLESIALNTNTILVCLVLLLFIGKFFCVRICEKLYDAVEYEDRELFYMFIAFWCISAFMIIVAWIGKYFDSEVAMVLGLSFCSLFTLFFIVILAGITIVRVIVPGFEDLHESIKAKKRGH